MRSLHFLTAPASTAAALVHFEHQALNFFQLPLAFSVQDLPTFNGIILLPAFAVAVVLAFALRWYFRMPGKAPTGEPTMDPYAVAYIQAGEKRAINAALARLVHTHSIVIAPKGTLEVLNPVPESAFELELAAYDAITAHGGQLSVTKLIRLMEPIFSDTQEKLRIYGLLVTAENELKGRLVPVLLLLTIAVLGVFKVLVNISLEEPFLLLTLCTVAAFLMSIPFFRPVHQSRYGSAYLRKLRRTYQSLETDPLETFVEAQDLPLAVALFGLGFLKNTELNWLEEVLEA